MNKPDNFTSSLELILRYLEDVSHIASKQKSKKWIKWCLAGLWVKIYYLIGNIINGLLSGKKHSLECG